jgi:hypothetical protein
MSEPTNPQQLAEAVRAEQRSRWQRGERVTAEEVLQPHPVLLADPVLALEIVYQEVMLREEAGEEPRLEEYQQRFPQFAAQLVLLFDVHQALESGQLLDEWLGQLPDLDEPAGS